MTVEIWSDIMCPFCYIGKRRFEEGLAAFAQRDQVNVVWRSFQLDPDLKTDPGMSVNQMLAAKKGWSVEQAAMMNDRVTGMAREAGLDYHLDKAVVANSWDAHRFSHLAAQHGVQDRAEEALFHAYFTEGKNTADHEVLAAIGEQLGISRDETLAMLGSDAYADAVQHDMERAQQIGVQGVPFFVLDNRYAVSGAQEGKTFAGALQAAWEARGPLTRAGTDENSCGPDGCAA
ncbi:MAG: DsbA family oxidoreductase [Bacteroidetes bacterium]|nr:DsbA family oxidoreductase [Bacteroidota bacterium]